LQTVYSLFITSFFHPIFFGLRNDLYCASWDVKLYSLTHFIFSLNFNNVETQVIQSVVQYIRGGRE